MLVKQTSGFFTALALDYLGFCDICDIYQLFKNVQSVMILILKKCSL